MKPEFSGGYASVKPTAGANPLLTANALAKRHWKVRLKGGLSFRCTFGG
jgi:hypothetical protein